ncbi:MAG TPA: phosphatase PAP2 family protein [Cyclobacteriaceae bacterium]|jgi:undecaprenyl-diphosphatase|nr:phosphatase PAP2 family protein [Cytophagales bacterium]HNT50724.1 phosphatase PAP2 family protein [Cyclobacteriaceae bacterium]HRE66999.1 phosphatase PAP2 family protein [Cyclobacteriaceae bacterium]HRF33173.1 phosphatase PAP2 family protein [Cyclobacteriaceae bacterium]
MLETLIDWDKELLIWLNSFHADWLDPVMILITKTAFWIPLYGFLIYLVFKSYKKEGWFILIGAALTVLLCDQITSSFMKPFFERLRPSHDPTLEGLLHHVNGYRGGRYGFSSGHAANTLGVALFVWLVLRSYYKWIGLVFIWALTMTYTRIYLGVHFPGDILVGGLIGLLCGWISFSVSQALLKRYRNKKGLPQI